MKYTLKSTETVKDRIEKIKYMITRFERLGHTMKVAKAKAKLRRLQK